MTRSVIRNARGSKVVGAVATAVFALMVTAGCNDTAPPADQEQEQEQEQQDGDDQQQPQQPRNSSSPSRTVVASRTTTDR
ncbi:hypothetical protein ACFQ0O_02915 [Saccharopolyspora spinosporotrichia]